MAVTKVQNANTTDKIDIAAVIVVPNSGVFAFDERERMHHRKGIGHVIKLVHDESLSLP